MKAAQPVELAAFDWQNPDYGPVYAERVQRIAAIEADKAQALPALRAYYKEHPADFINDWGMTCDPRNLDIGKPVTTPFLLFPRQREYIDWLHEHWRGRRDGLCEKSRDMGVSWLTVGFGAWMWLFYDDVVVGYGSRKEEYIDRIGDPKSLFWKLRQFVHLLPPFFKPAGYDPRKNAPYMRLINPENGATVVGEAGNNIGRGNRSAIYFVDEAAFLEDQESAQAALSQTTNCRIESSTPNGAGDAFARRRHSGKVDVFTFHWREDPRKDEKWYQRQKERFDDVVVAREIDINYESSLTNTWIPGALVDAAQRTGPADVEGVGGFIISIDAAHEGDDESVITARKGRLTLPQETYRKLDGPQLAGHVEEFCADLEEGGDHIHEIIIELDGPGVSCYDHLRQGRYAQIVNGVHTGNTGDASQSVNPSLKDGRNYNLRARMWREARQYLKEGPVSLPPCGELKAQLCALTYRYKDGMLLMQKKSEYKKANGCSPDRADSWVLGFAGGAVPMGSRAPDPGRPHSGAWA